MNRRELIVGSIAASAFVAPTIANGVSNRPRLVWVAYCMPPHRSNDTILNVRDYCESQCAQGHRVALVVERANEDSLVVIEQEFDTDENALEALERFNRLCFAEEVGKDFDNEFGCVRAIAVVPKGKVLDIHRFAENHVQEQVDRLSRRLNRLSAKVQGK